jgi:uncharacterized protein GlcG (DUF336 family)
MCVLPSVPLGIPKMKKIVVVFFITHLIACGSGKSIDPKPSTNCSGSCISNEHLTVNDVKQIIGQAALEAQARNAAATIAVSDRVGNVLAVFRMNNTAPHSVTIASSVDSNNNSTVDTGLEGIRLPTTLANVKIDGHAAIAKAITAAYLSTEGNAFSTRTANQIVQEHFNPGELFQAAGPLFGVQFSQLACSDVMRKFNLLSPDVGPKHSPLGLAADPGGFPLYKNGTVVGGVGVMADGIYGIDKQITDLDKNLDELIALAATYGFTPPSDRRADRITADGKTFRFSDAEFKDLVSNPAQASTPTQTSGFDLFNTVNNELVAVAGYSTNTIVAGKIFAQAESGIRPATVSSFAAVGGFVLVDENNLERFSVTAGTALSTTEVETLLAEALKVANHTRAQIRRPLNTPARVNISVVDINGDILGILRSRDAPIFGIDVSVQKARTAVFFSSNQAATLINQLPDARYLVTNNTQVGIKASVDLDNYTQALRSFIGNSSALTDGAQAYSARAIGNLARPFYPDGIDTNSEGPLSKPIQAWSPFSTGFQLDIVINGILQHVLSTAGVGIPDVGMGCGGINLANDFTPTASALTTSLLKNGLQIFPGSIPIYRNNVLVGAIGVSGDGVDQDDMIAFLGVQNASLAPSGSIQLPPRNIRSDQLEPRGVRLRFIQCPQAPFINTNEQTPCAGL